MLYEYFRVVYIVRKKNSFQLVSFYAPSSFTYPAFLFGIPFQGSLHSMNDCTTKQYLTKLS